MLVIRGPRVSVRDWRPGESNAMHRWRGDPAVMRHVSWGSRSAEESGAEHAACLSDADLGFEIRQRFFLAVVLSSSEQRVIGSVGFRRSAPGGDEADLGYFLEPAWWGRGLAAEASRLLLELAFGPRLQLARVRASCRRENVASERVMQKLGMRLEAERDARLEYVIEGSDWESL